MNRINLLAISLLVLLFLLNVFSFRNINSRFISFLNSSLEEQATLCGSYMEKELESFENDLNRLLFEYNFSSVFKDKAKYEESKTKLEVFYSKYRDLITGIYIYDNNKNYFGLYLNDDDKFVDDSFSRQRQQQLLARNKVEREGFNYLYHYVYFEADKISGNIIVKTDFEKFAEKIFSLYPKDRTISWKWVVSADGEILCNDFEEDVEVGSLAEIADSLDMFASGLKKHELYFKETEVTQKVHSSYYPLSIFNQSLGIVFSASQGAFNRYFIFQNLIVAIAAFILSLALIVYLLWNISHRMKREEGHKMAEIVLRQIIEKFPVGILILDPANVIRNVNTAAQRMLFVGKDEKLIGKNFSEQFLISNKFLLQDGNEISDNTDYIYYEKDGVENVIFKVEDSCRIAGDELKLIGLIDVSTIERSRKQEVAANRAKSDFLASMSHEIRTPMNGILGMVSELMNSNMADEEKDKIRLIKKSSDLLMTIINDILDFSKIEAGKMMLEEIPFNLREEISLVIDLYSSLAKEKGLELETNIKTSVPDKLIGDPFRLRQVWSNLLSNAIKFTEQGKIVLGADLMENEQGTLQILFWVEDTGIGIPDDKINSIFNNYSQTAGAVSRKFGGTGLGTAISKQLVELMNGEIWVESPSHLSGFSETPGSKFSFTVTVYSNDKIEKEFNFDDLNNINQISVLFLTKDPHPERNSINKLLNSFGINIVTKIYQDSSIDAVIHHLKSKQDFYHLVVMADRKNLDGFALAKKLKDEKLMMHFPVIMVSNNDQSGNYKISKKLKIDYYLIEPVEGKELFDIIKVVFPGIKDQRSMSAVLNSLPNSLNILLAEDNLINQKVAQAIFKNIGYEIDIANSGKEALEKTKEKEYDIIFMDLFMPEMDGFETTDVLRKEGVRIPIIAMSADNSDERKQEALNAGIDEYLAKPARMEAVKELLIRFFSTKNI